MISTRRERNFTPGLVTVRLHTNDGSVVIEGSPFGPDIPAPGKPELPLSTYKFAGEITGYYEATDLRTFLAAFAKALEEAPTGADRRLVLAIHAEVLGWDISDAYAWRYDVHTQSFASLTPAEAAAFLPEDTRTLIYSLDKPPFATVSALWTATDN
ncbi:hypothetical protein ACIHJG_34170 [Streptomyces sp. NPDC052415]|uniref:hypothetical protein n=1 Tax=Streptomyces sp. NPDC052415 TaxID=3365690 RepID=UPI0037D2BD6F